MSNLWFRTKREKLIHARGGKCERCGGPPPFEFHHAKPTGLNGRGRGSNHRTADILRYPKSYIMLCPYCHDRAHREAA